MTKLALAVMAAALAATLALGAAYADGVPAVPAAPAASPAPHGKEFWRAVAANHYAVPAGESAAALVRELSGYLGSPDPELRDDFGYTFPYVWIKRQRLLSADDLRGLLATWTANLKTGLGESGTDSVLLRSFSALDLSILADLDAERPFLTAPERAALLDAALAYLRDEKDLRGYDRQKGWMHSAAHTADLLAPLAASPTLRPEDQGRILQEIAAKLEAPVYAWGETERMAHTLRAVVSRADFDNAAFDAFLDRLDREAKPLWKETPLDPARFAAVENGKHLLQSLCVLLELKPRPDRDAVKAKVLAALASR